MKPKESEIQTSILEYLKLKNVFCWRQNTQGVPVRGRGGKQIGWRPIQMKGISDILGVKSGGQFFAIEVKRPGGKLTDCQKEFLGRVHTAGGLAILATSVDDVISAGF